ncbi:histidinol-phosphate aminotransferase [Bacteroidales bacterium]|nr:histidinol-phosphate aminotransferase [Bacteroidales bacterium]
MNLKALVRKNIWDLKPYSTARNEFKGEASIYLDANENPYNAPLNRYPDPLQWKLKEALEKIKKVAKQQIFLGNGSDEPIDLIIKVFCEPSIDNILAIDPTYGMYKVAADINNVEYRKVLLDENFQFSSNKLLQGCNEQTKIIFLCSPNNPTGNSLDREEILKTLQEFEGIVVIDEAYIDFSSQSSFLEIIEQHPNLIVLQTLSKAWASAAIRLGMAFASAEIIDLLNKVKYPYNINMLTQNQALVSISKYKEVEEWVKALTNQRLDLHKELSSLSLVERIYPSDANFLLVKVEDANSIYQFLVHKGIIVRNRNSVSLCLNCLRITVGSKEENHSLIEALREYPSKK